MIHSFLGNLQLPWHLQSYCYFKSSYIISTTTCYLKINKHPIVRISSVVGKVVEIRTEKTFSTIQCNFGFRFLRQDVFGWKWQVTWIGRSGAISIFNVLCSLPIHPPTHTHTRTVRLGARLYDVGFIEIRDYWIEVLEKIIIIIRGSPGFLTVCVVNTRN